MLPRFYRFRVSNDTDQTFTYDGAARIEVKIIPWKFTDGARANGSEVADTTDLLASGETLTTSSETEGAVIDNSSGLFIGFTGTFYGKADVTSTDGHLGLFMEGSVDNVRWPSDMADFAAGDDMILIAKLTFSTDAVDEDRAMDIEF